jgi:Spy/CpxP family protein refolding chaperone
MKTHQLKQAFFLLFCTAFFFTDIDAQDPGRREQIKEKLKANHVAYITNELDLTEEESQKFWPIYNQYRQEMDALKEENTPQQVKNMTDKEADEFLNKMLEKKARELDVQKKYIQKLKSAIPAKKIALLLHAEREFREKVVQNMKNRRENKRERKN